jgi:hypothetical protein
MHIVIDDKQFSHLAVKGVEMLDHMEAAKAVETAVTGVDTLDRTEKAVETAVTGVEASDRTETAVETAITGEETSDLTKDVSARALAELPLESDSCATSPTLRSEPDAANMGSISEKEVAFIDHATTNDLKDERVVRMHDVNEDQFLEEIKQLRKELRAAQERAELSRWPWMAVSIAAGLVAGVAITQPRSAIASSPDTQVASAAVSGIVPQANVVSAPQVQGKQSRRLVPFCLTLHRPYDGIGRRPALKDEMRGALQNGLTLHFDMADDDAEVDALEEMTSSFMQRSVQSTRSAHSASDADWFTIETPARGEMDRRAL